MTTLFYFIRISFDRDFEKYIAVSIKKTCYQNIFKYYGSNPRFKSVSPL